ncbi:hypothetical protein PCC7418_0645 [Halothece sp. PCC 7418]|uniref:DUF4230 domain-containing protein n=1 Tax=Halothece sp. (strain PCC 7418) TaxID=65093 RepID=UPI0002A06E8D|nr:DUF4230 domain-containing protein [Halothece sp. PCC 7418]AFZ42868.1 hypothetical protein PCC7418_0645 [Halothece sp. PCC 7418]
MVQTSETSTLENSGYSSEQPLPPTTSPASIPTRPSFSFLKAFLLMTTGGITLVTLLILIGIWRAGTGFFSLVESLFNAPPPQPEVAMPTLVVNQIQGVSDLTTAVFTMEAIVPTQQDRKLGNVTLGTTRLLYIAQGEVRAGVDLSAITAEDIVVNEETDSVVVNIPSAEILDHNLNVNHSQVYDYDRGFLNLGPDVAPQLQTLAQQKTLDKVLSAACQQGILDQARDRAQLTIKELLTASGYSNVKVVSEVSANHQCAVK